MYPAQHVIRHATSDDAIALRKLAVLASQSSLRGEILVGEIGGRMAAAVSLESMRVISDGSDGSERLSSHLLMRARGIKAQQENPSLRLRLIALMPWGRKAPAAEMDQAA